MADTYYYSGPVIGGRDDALLSISNITNPETEDRRRAFRLKSLNLTPMNLVSTVSSCNMTFGRFQGGCDGGEVIPVLKLDSAAPDLPSGIRVLTGATIAPGYVNVGDAGAPLPSYVSNFSEFGFGSRQLNATVSLTTAAYSLNVPALGSYGSVMSAGTGAILTNGGAVSSTTVGVQLVTGGFAFAIKTVAPDNVWANVWNADVTFTVNSNTYVAAFHFISYGTSLGLLDNAIDVPAPQSTTVPFVIYTTEGSSYVIEIKTINMTLLGTVNNSATAVFTDQLSMRICRTNVVSGGMTVSPVPGNTSAAAPSQLRLAVNRDPWASLGTGLSINGLDIIGDLGYPSAGQALVRKINIVGRRLLLPAVRNGLFVGSTPNFSQQTLRGWEWSYDTAPIISPGEALSLIQENAPAYGGWWVDAVIWSDPPPAAAGGESSYAFIG